MYKFYKACVWEWKQDKRPVTIKTEQAALLYTEGRAYVDFERKRKQLNSKLLIYVQPESIVTLYPADDNDTVVIGLYFRAYVLEQETEDRLVYRQDYSMLPNHGFVLKPITSRTPGLILELVQQSMQISPDGYLCNRNLNELVQQIIMQMNSSRMDRPTAEQAVTETIREMLAHYDRNWTREEAARSKQFNVSHFSRAFQSVSSYSFSALLGKIRLNQARILLLSTEMTLDQIAHRVGFTNGLYLSRRFKLDCGLAPTEFRALLKNKSLRIAALQQAGDLLALGAAPIAASFAPWQTSPLLHESLLRAGTINIYEMEDFELLKEQQPDLILLPDYILLQNASRLRQFEQIAPILFFSSYAQDSITRFMQLADIVSRRRQAERWIAEYREIAEKWRQRLAKIIAPDESAACYELRGEQLVIIWFSSSRSSYNFYQGLQLKPPPALLQCKHKQLSYIAIPLEQLPQFAADHMFVIHQHADSIEQLYRLLQADHIWSSLPAMQNKQLYSLPLQQFWTDDAATLLQQLPLIVSAAESTKQWAAKKSGGQ